MLLLFSMIITVELEEVFMSLIYEDESYAVRCALFEICKE